MLIESEHGHSHHHGTGIRWLDLIVAISAIFISVLSLFISIEHGRTMAEMVKENQKMVAGSTLPFLIWGGDLFDPVANQPRLQLILKNAGVGPARIDWFQLRYKGVPYHSETALLRACCSAFLPKSRGATPGVFYGNVSGLMLPQRESIDVITLTHEAGLDLINALNDARKNISVRTCYCSVLEECWQIGFNENASRQPARVESCVAPPSDTLW